jgi:hypothetical protein
MHNGSMSVLVEIDGIDDEHRSDNVDVTLYYTADPMAKNASGSQILPDYTYRVTDKAEYRYFFARLHGRIVDGVLTTETVDRVSLHLAVDIPVILYHAAMRLQLMPDGSIKGVLGGYQDWRNIVNANSHSLQESLDGAQVPGMYDAFRRAADGLQDPVSGECNGISSAYDIEGVPAFIPTTQSKALLVDAKADGQGRQ